MRGESIGVFVSGMHAQVGVSVGASVTTGVDVLVGGIEVAVAVGVGVSVGPCTTISPVIPKPQCGTQKYGNVPALEKVTLKLNGEF
jgi:hypothetical protein